MTKVTNMSWKIKLSETNEDFVSLVNEYSTLMSEKKKLLQLKTNLEVMSRIITDKKVKEKLVETINTINSELEIINTKMNDINNKLKSL